MIFHLLQALHGFCQEAFSQLVQPTSDEAKAMAKAQVYIGPLPHKTADNKYDHPFVLVRPQAGEDTEHQTKVMIDLIVGAYDLNNNEGGLNHVANMISRLRGKLLSKRIIAQQFAIELPIKWSIPDEQPNPFWVGALETSWVLPMTVQQYDTATEISTYGSGYDHQKN